MHLQFFENIYAITHPCASTKEKIHKFFWCIKLHVHVKIHSNCTHICNCTCAIMHICANKHTQKCQEFPIAHTHMHNIFLKLRTNEQLHIYAVVQLYAIAHKKKVITNCKYKQMKKIVLPPTHITLHQYGCI
jgi:hypothetical protein